MFEKLLCGQNCSKYGKWGLMLLFTVEEGEGNRGKMEMILYRKYTYNDGMTEPKRVLGDFE